MDDKLACELMAQAERLVKATERIADALEAGNAADPLRMIQDALGADERVTAPQSSSLTAADVAEFFGRPEADVLPPEEMWRMR